MGFPALLERPGLLINSHDPLRGHVLKHIRRTTPVRPALLGGAQGTEIQNPKTYNPNREAGITRLATKRSVRKAHTKPQLILFPLSAAE
jgi:hypothetical protein